VNKNQFSFVKFRIWQINFQLLTLNF